MHNRMRRRPRGGLSLAITLLTALGLVVAACGGETTNETGGQTTTGEPTVAQMSVAEGQDVLAEAHALPPAPRDAGNPRLRGSQEMTFEEFVKFVVNDANSMWEQVFANVNATYSAAKPRTFAEPISVTGGCGDADPDYGPFYCDKNQTVYYPVNWVVPVSGRPVQDYGDFAVAISIAHEVGHHAQQQLGILEAEQSGQYTSLQIELQADCFAGLWGYTAFYEGLVESGDIDEALSLRAELGDLPEQPRGGPGAHGTPEERVEAFLTGYDYGEPGRCLDYTPLPEGTTVTASPGVTTVTVSPEATTGG